MFIHPKHANEITSRCIQHILEDEDLGLKNPEYLIRCECLSAIYCTDKNTGQNSVVVPFEKPQTGENFCTYIFRFMCFSSCKNSLDRRAITIIFTLENEGQVIGRRCLPVKICACPSRDSKIDDEKAEEGHGNSSKKRKNETAKDKGNNNKELYTISTPDYKKYKFLKEVSHAYDLSKFLPEDSSKKLIKTGSEATLLSRRLVQSELD